MRIGMFLSTREHIVMLSSIYQILLKKGYKIYLFDVLEETGWFEKGVQYVSLNYNKPEDILQVSDYREALDRLIHILERNRIDLVLYTGYSDYLLAVAIASKLMGVDAIHVGSGQRLYDLSIESEVLRQLLDHVTPFHITFIPLHSKNLLNEGVDPRYVRLTGCPVIDLVNQRLSEALDKSTILDEMGVKAGEYIAVVVNNRMSISQMDQFRDFSSSMGEYLILPLSKRNKRLLMERGEYYETMAEYDILFMELFDYLDHLNFIYNAKSVVTDQEWVALESVLLNRPTTLLICPGSRPLLIRSDYVNIVELDDSLSKSMRRVYMRFREGDAGRYYGGGAAAEVFSEYIHEVPKLSLKYPDIKLYVEEGNGVKAVSPKTLPEKYRRLLRLI